MSKVSEKKEDFNLTLWTIQNIVEGEKIDRFKFTIKEKSALAFVTELLEAHINELEHL